MQKLDPGKKQAILSAAKSRFYRYGIQKTTMQEIARDVGFSVGTLYLYFKNKDEIILACTQAFNDRHQQLVSAILEANLASDEKLRRYVLERFRAAKGTREGSEHAAEIARTVLRLAPKRIEEETALMLEVITRILEEGCTSGIFNHVNFETDVEVFAYAIAYFFPTAGKEPNTPLEEQKLLVVVNWFIHQWTRAYSIVL